MTSLFNNNIASYDIPNKLINNNPSIISKNNNFLVNECNQNMNLDGTRAELDNIFYEKSIYNFPYLIICDDVKRNNQNSNIYKNYSDIIYDSCGNRFNMRNLKDSAGLLQEGYSKNIDVDSHLKNINYYADKCYYDNWKLSPTEPSLDKCHGLKHNSSLLSLDYAPVGRDNTYKGICNTNSECNTSKNVPNPTNDSNCDNNIRKRYDFTNQKLQKESCIKPADWISFKHSETPKIDNISKFPNEKRTLELLNTINKDVQHDYYQFFEDNKCMTFPQQRLFNNVTRRSMLPSHHNLEDMGPKYFK